MNLKVGDWVRSYSAGIWQIYRILDYKCINPITGKDHDKTTVFSKRFLSNSFKRSFKEEICDPSLVTKLTEVEEKELKSFIAENTSLFKKFQKFEPKAIDCIYNARIGVPNERSAADVSELLSGNGYVKDTEIEGLLFGLGFDTKAMPYWTVQFISEGFHCVDGHLAFKFSRVLGH